jgi:hypothetical protein
MRTGGALAAASLATLALAAPAEVKTYTLDGTQTTVDEAKGLFKMRGSLIGEWTMTNFVPVATTPTFKATADEKFVGCLDLRGDGRCKGDPRGTLYLTMTYEALFASPDPASLVWGACLHPVLSGRGEGDFRGAEGVLTFVDTPAGRGVKTRYIGNLTLPRRGSSKARAPRALASAARMSCGSSR